MVQGQSLALPPAGLGWTGTGTLRWYNDEGHTNLYAAGNITPTGNITLYGRYDGDVTNTVTLLNLARGKINQYQVVQGQSLSLPPAGLGWTGPGTLEWYSNADHTGQISGSYTPTGNATLYGRYTGDIPVEKTFYSVTLVRFSTKAVKSYVREEGTSFALPAPAELGWTGTGDFTWYDDADHTVAHSGNSVTVNGYVTLYGQFEGDVPYAVTLLSLSMNKIVQYQVPRGSTLSLPAIAQLGWNVQGGENLDWYWYKDITIDTRVTYANQHSGPTITPTADTVLYNYNQSNFTEFFIRYDGFQYPQLTYIPHGLVNLEYTLIKMKLPKKGLPGVPGGTDNNLGWPNTGTPTWYTDATYTTPLNTVNTQKYMLFARFSGDSSPAGAPYKVTLLNEQEGKITSRIVAPGTFTLPSRAELGWAMSNRPLVLKYASAGGFAYVDYTHLDFDESPPGIDILGDTVLIAKWGEGPNFVDFFDCFDYSYVYGANNGEDGLNEDMAVALINLKKGKMKQYKGLTADFPLPSPAALGWSGVYGWYTDPACTQLYANQSGIAYSANRRHVLYTK